MIVDRLGRKFTNLRVSLTAACNYACTYCVPNGKRLMKAENELSVAELVKAVILLRQATGIDKVRVTGGEPLITPKFDDFLLAIMDLGLVDVSLTTNGQLLTGKRDVIAYSGLRRMNISLDTLNPLKFKRIARGGDLDTVLRGIESMLELGLKLKINMVPMRTENLSEVVPMLRYCLERGIELRFIELMRMGHLLGANGFAADFVSMETLLDEIGQVFEFSRTEAPYDSTAPFCPILFPSHVSISKFLSSRQSLRCRYIMIIILVINATITISIMLNVRLVRPLKNLSNHDFSARKT